MGSWKRGMASAPTTAEPDDQAFRIIAPHACICTYRCQQRVAYIAIQTIKRILSRHLRIVGLEKEAHQCEEAEDLPTARAANSIADNGVVVYTARSAALVAYCAAQAAKQADSWARHAEFAAKLAAVAVLDAAHTTDQREVFTVATQILDGALTLGERPKPINTSFAIARMEAIKQRALELDRGSIGAP